MLRRRIAVVVLVTALGGVEQQGVVAHAALRLAYPLEGATLGDTPSAVQLSFWEKPEPALSIIRVLDQTGASYHIGRPTPVAGDPLSLAVAVRPLDRGIYLVSWRILSAVDGHATAGVYAFGVRASPAAAAAAATTYPAASPLETLARWLFIVGLVGLLGGASAGVAQFGGTRELVVSTGGWLLAAVGLLLLADSQRRTAAAAVADLLNTFIGRALLWRAVALGAAAAALVLARWSAPRARRLALAGVALASLAAMMAHVAAGHAAAGRWPTITTVGAQFVHFAAVGVWLGGLAALLIGARGAPSNAKTAAVRRFSTMAAAALFIVAATGIVRAINELSSWNDLGSTPYGRLLAAKAALLVIIASLGALNRWLIVPVVAISLRGLRRTAGGELAVATCALAATAVLGTLAPPAASPRTALLGISVSGIDFARSVRVDLTAASDQPGANRFVVHAVDYDTRTPVHARRINLLFTALDDPDVEPTFLALTPGPGDSYVGSGANMAIDGRWRVNVIIERTVDSADVPLEIETRVNPRWVSIQRLPGQAPAYTVEIQNQGIVELSPDSERPGPSKISVRSFDFIGDPRMVESVIVTAATVGPAHQLPVRRLDRSRFVADVELEPGSNTIAAVVRTTDGARLRAKIVIDLPRR